jgi:hypothetical protein
MGRAVVASAVQVPRGLGSRSQPEARMQHPTIPLIGQPPASRGAAAGASIAP